MEARIEYIVWGVPAGEYDEVVLHTKSTSRAMAEWVSRTLEAKHGCTSVRIQEVILGETSDVQRMFRQSVKA